MKRDARSRARATHAHAAHEAKQLSTGAEEELRLRLQSWNRYTNL